MRAIGTLHDAGVLRETTGRRRWPWLLLVPLLLVAVAALPHPRSDDLADLALSGQRGPACVRVIVAPDVSGSMTSFEQVRTTALAEVARWAPENLRADDELAVIVWDDAAEIALAPVAVGTGGELPTSLSQPGSGGSEIGPAVALLPELAPTHCRSALVAISDGAISDDGNSGGISVASILASVFGTETPSIEQILRGAGVDRVAIILPNGASAPEAWMQAFPYSLQFHADPESAAQTGRAVAEAIAATTDQQLVER